MNGVGDAGWRFFRIIQGVDEGGIREPCFRGIAAVLPANGNVRREVWRNFPRRLRALSGSGGFAGGRFADINAVAYPGEEIAGKLSPENQPQQAQGADQTKESDSSEE